MTIEPKNSPWGKKSSKEVKSNSSDNQGGEESSSNESWENGSLGGANRYKRSTGSRGSEPPELDEMVRKGQEKLKSLLPDGLNGRFISLIILVVIGIWAATGIYRVGPSERGVELVFGKYTETTLSGLHYNFPRPIGEVYIPSVDAQRRLNVGFIGDDSGKGGQSISDIPEESIMLTSDENIVDLDFTVLWRISDPELYLFAIREPESTIKIVAESAMREVVGQTTFDAAVTKGRQEIEEKTLVLMQKILDDYKSGVIVERIELQASDPPKEVIDAFNDVQRARQDRDRLSNEAEAYANSIVPQARGEAERLLREAEGYKESLIQNAKGEAQRFNSVYDTYRQAPDVTRQRMYLETMGNVYRNSNKVILDQHSGKKGDNQGVVSYLPLTDLLKLDKGAKPATGAGSATVTGPATVNNSQSN